MANKKMKTPSKTASKTMSRAPHSSKIPSSVNSLLKETPIAIVGMSSIFPQSENLERYWENILHEINCITDIPKTHWDVDAYYDSDPKAPDKTYCKKGGFIPEINFNPMEFGLPPNILEVTDVAQLLSLVAAREVLKDAGYYQADRSILERTGITLGVGGGQKLIVPLTARLQYPVLEQVLKSSGVGDKDVDVIVDKFKKAYIPWEENSFPGMLGNVIAGRIANRFDLGGINCVLDAACAGSLSAIKMAVSELLEHNSDMMITGGVDMDNSIFMYMCFAKTPAFTANDVVQPFDKDSKGIMIGEGIGMTILKRLEDAERDGDKIYAIIKGVGSSSDGKFKSIYAPRPFGQAIALERAYKDTGFEPGSIGLVEAHGTGTAAGDLAEFTGLKDVFKRENKNKRQVALGSVKSQIGHTKAAAGAAGFIKTALALHHKVLPATINVETPNPKFDIEDSAFYLNAKTRPWIPKDSKTPRRAGVSAFGFGGTNFHFVLEEYKYASGITKRLHHVPHAVLVAASNPQELKSICQTQLEKLNGSDGESKFEPFLNEFQPKNIPASDSRVGFVCNSWSEAKSLLEKTIETFDTKAVEESWSLPQGVHFRAKVSDQKGKVVALFPGQGSQYLEMGKDLAYNFPAMMETFCNVNEAFDFQKREPLTDVIFPIPVFETKEQSEHKNTLQKTENAQPAIGAFSVGLFKIFEQAGFKADFAAGHSFGELTALWAAGAISETDFFMLAEARGSAMKALDDPSFDAGTMIAVVGDVKKLKSELKSLKNIVIANENSDTQVVIAGPIPDIEAATDVLKKKKFSVIQLPVSGAFHTKLVGHAQKPFANAVNQASWKKTTLKVYSNSTGKSYPASTKDMQNVIKNHLMSPVLFKAEIEEMYQAGGRIFVEFGPKNVLTKLVSSILKGKPHIAVALNVSDKKSSDRQLREAYLQLCIEGISFDQLDPYQKSLNLNHPMNITLNGANYVSPKTAQAYQDCLVDGHQIQGTAVVPAIVPAPAPIQPIVASTPAPPVTPAIAPPNNIQHSLDVIEKNLERFHQQQEEVSSVHRQYLEEPVVYANAYSSIVKEQFELLKHQPNTQIPASIEKSLSAFQKHHQETMQVHETYLKRQSAENTEGFRLMEQYKSVTSGAPVSESLEHKTAPAALVEIAPEPIVQSKPIAEPVINPTVNPVVKKIPATVPTPVPRPVQAPVPTQISKPTGITVAMINGKMLEIVAEKTGYTADMLELDMDMEADLGIDSIKRVEILGSVQDAFPQLPTLNPDILAEMRTLQQIVDHIEEQMPEAPELPVPNQELTADSTANTTVPSGVGVDEINAKMLEVVAEKTGYTSDMLELDMDMEADLGIDSIKRVELVPEQALSQVRPPYLVSDGHQPSNPDRLELFSDSHNWHR